MIQLAAQTSFALGILAVTYLSSIPSESLPHINFSDKLLHIAAYAGVALVGGIGFRGTRSALLIAAGLLALGSLLEVVQIEIPGRSASIFDALADGAGITIGLAGAWAIDFLGGRNEASQR